MERAEEVRGGELADAFIEPWLLHLVVAGHPVPPLVGRLMGNRLAVGHHRAAEEHDSGIFVARTLAPGLGDDVARPLVRAEDLLEPGERGHGVLQGRRAIAGRVPGPDRDAGRGAGHRLVVRAGAECEVAGVLELVDMGPADEADAAAGSGDPDRRRLGRDLGADPARRAGRLRSRRDSACCDRRRRSGTSARPA